MIAKVNQSLFIWPKRVTKYSNLVRKVLLLSFFLVFVVVYFSFSQVPFIYLQCSFNNRQRYSNSRCDILKSPQGRHLLLTLQRQKLKRYKFTYSYKDTDLQRYVHIYTDIHFVSCLRTMHFARRRIKISAIIKIAHADIVFGLSFLLCLEAYSSFLSPVSSFNFCQSFVSRIQRIMGWWCLNAAWGATVNHKQKPFGIQNAPKTFPGLRRWVTDIYE